MDYEKLYKEAIDRIKDWCEGSEITDPKEVVEFVFPELAESEDERIRKWIINFIEVRLPDAAEFEPEYRAALAYLEKQKEQKPIEYLKVEKIKREIEKWQELAIRGIKKGCTAYYQGKLALCIDLLDSINSLPDTDRPIITAEHLREMKYNDLMEIYKAVREELLRRDEEAGFYRRD